MQTLARYIIALLIFLLSHFTDQNSSENAFAEAPITEDNIEQAYTCTKNSKELKAII